MTVGDSHERSTRVEREVLEILERADAAGSPVENLQAAVRRQRASAGSRVTQGANGVRLQRWLSPATTRIVGSVAFATAAVVVADVSRLLALLLALASSAAFFSLWVPARGSVVGDGPTRWRGRDLRDEDSSFGRGPEAPRPWRGPKRPSR